MAGQDSVPEERSTVNGENGSEPLRNDRRTFVRKIVGIAGGLASVLLGRQAKEVAAQEVSGAGTSGQVAYWTNTSELAGFPSTLNRVNSSIAFDASNTASVSRATVGGGSGNMAVISERLFFGSW